MIFESINLSCERKYADKEKKCHLSKRLCLISWILKNILKLRQYKANDTILTYVSTKIEVDTFGLIRQALKDGKRVAVPRCIDNSREMDFYYITSLNQLEPRTFGVLEPIKGAVRNSKGLLKGLVYYSGLGIRF